MKREWTSSRKYIKRAAILVSSSALILSKLTACMAFHFRQEENLLLHFRKHILSSYYWSIIEDNMIEISNTPNTPSIYKLANKITGRIYIGQAKRTRNRWNAHLCDLRKNKHGNTYLQRAFNKYGEDNFEFLIMVDLSNVTEDQLRQILKREELKALRENPKNYNSDQGGESQFKQSKKTLSKLSKKRRAMWEREGFRENQINCQLQIWKNPNYKKLQALIHKESWKDPKIREKYIKAAKKYWSDPINRAIKSDKTREFWKNKKAKEAASEHSKKIWADPKRLKAISEKRKALWKNLEFRKKMLERRKRGKSKSP